LPGRQGKIDATQIKIIHIAKTQLGLSDDNYRLILAAQCQGKSSPSRQGKTSSKDLTYREAHGLIEYFKTLGFRVKPVNAKPRRAPAPANVAFIATPEQIRMIDALRGEVKWRYSDGYERWLSKYLKVDRVRTNLQAIRAIEGLKGLIKTQHNSRGVKAITL
jgi:phage gp16-like protein